MAAAQNDLAWTPAPELDEKYDNFAKVHPTVVPISDPKLAEKGYSGHLNEMQKAQLFQLRSVLEADGYTKELDTLTMVCDSRSATRAMLTPSQAAFSSCPQLRRRTVEEDVSFPLLLLNVGPTLRC